MSKKLPFFLLFLCSFSSFSKQVAPLCKEPQGAGFSKGDGTKLNPYLICNHEQFALVSEDTTLLSKWFKLGDDLSFAGKKFPQIGSVQMPFQGGFDGDGYTLSEITLNADIRAPFGKIQNAQLENVIIDDIHTEEAANNKVAGLVGVAENSTLHHINVHRINLYSINYSAGVIGESINSSLSYASVDGSLSQDFGTDASAGLIGMAFQSDVFACTSHVNITSLYTGQGEIAGVSALIGHAESSRIRNVYADGVIDYSNIPVPNLHGAGGLIGTMSSSLLSNAYYAGKILFNASSENEIGVVVGEYVNSYTSDVYWDTEVSGITESVVGVGKNTATMKKKAFWLNQGFGENIWRIKNNQYPRLFGVNN